MYHILKQMMTTVWGIQNTTTEPAIWSGVVDVMPEAATRVANFTVIIAQRAIMVIVAGMLIEAGEGKCL